MELSDYEREYGRKQPTYWFASDDGKPQKVESTMPEDDDLKKDTFFKYQPCPLVTGNSLRK